MHKTHRDFQDQATHDSLCGNVHEGICQLLLICSFKDLTTYCTAHGSLHGLRVQLWRGCTELQRHRGNQLQPFYILECLVDIVPCRCKPCTSSSWKAHGCSNVPCGFVLPCLSRPLHKGVEEAQQTKQQRENTVAWMTCKLRAQGGECAHGMETKGPATYILDAPHLKQSVFLAKLCWLHSAQTQSPGLTSIPGFSKPSQPFSMKKRDRSWRLSWEGPWELEGRKSEGCGVMAFCSLTSALASACQQSFWSPTQFSKVCL